MNGKALNLTLISSLLLAGTMASADEAQSWLSGDESPGLWGAESSRLFDNVLPADPLSHRSSSFGFPLLDTPEFRLGLQGGQRSNLTPEQRATSNLAGNLDDSTEVGIFTVGRYGNYLLGSRVSTDVGDNDSGVLGEFMAGYVANVGDRLDFSLGLGTTWGDPAYTSRYYGGPAGELGDAGFRNASAQVTACYQLTDMWSLGAKVGYLRYLGEVAYSPTVSENQLQGSVVTGLEFKYQLPGTGAPASNLYQPACNVR